MGLTSSRNLPGYGPWKVDLFELMKLVSHNLSAAYMELKDVARTYPAGTAPSIKLARLEFTPLSPKN
jgi:hypothetical protein